MKKNVGVITEDDYLFKKIELATTAIAEVSRISADGAHGGFDCIIADIDTCEAPLGAVSASRTRECRLPIPFSFEALEEIVLGARSAKLVISKQEKCAYLYGEHIKLTDVEYSLLSCLISHGGFVSRAEVLSEVWGDVTNDGIINVYVHYLREKLEKQGEKIIISSRNQGYKIDEKYLDGGALC